jgi:predicted DNA-binding protein with PD1-like motif
MQQITFRLKPGQLLKEEIEKVAIDKNIQAGVLLSIVGSLSTAVLRMAGAKPDKQIINTYEGPFEIVSGTGTISKDGCHVHISISDKEGRVLGGHLKDGCIVEVTAEIVIGVFENVHYKRIIDINTGFPELESEQL